MKPKSHPIKLGDIAEEKRAIGIKIAKAVPKRIGAIDKSSPGSQNA